VDDCLADIQYVHLVIGQNLTDCRGETGLVFAGKRY
jgi:hypothetical protein